MAEPRVVALVQARMGSSRLPGKVLMDVAGKSMLMRVVERLRRARRLTAVWVATSTAPADDAVAEACAEGKVDCFRGHEADVLDRFRRAARAAGADVVVRVTADCPLIDPAVADRVIEAHLAGGCDYAANVIRCTYPDGLDVEAFSADALERAWAEARLPAEREHVTPYLRASGRFRVKSVEGERDFSGQRWTVDEPTDLAFVRAVYEKMGRDDFGWEDVLALLEKEPAMMDANKGILRNEGYYKSLAAEPPVPPIARSLEKSAALLARARLRIPGASQTFSKAPTQFVQGAAPNFIVRGKGCRVWDADGNEYIDYPMALGPVILGHNDPAVSKAVKERMEEGVVFSLPHPLEVELAEDLARVVPCAEMVRYGKNGSDATAGAVRAARAFTGRDKVACSGYHGWQDWFIGTTTRNRGVPEAVRRLTLTFPYNDVAALRKLFKENPGEIAAVVMEPVGVEEPKEGFLAEVRELTRKEGSLLVFDEIVTGFRVALGGAQGHFGVTPDLACFGKALANGFPLSVVAGRADVMKIFDEIFFSFTSGGEILSLAAARAVIREMETKDVIGHLWGQGRKLKEGYAVLARCFGLEKTTSCAGLPPRTVISFRDAGGAESLVFKSLFQQECLKRGVLFSGGQNPCFAHGDADVERTLRVYRAALEVLAEAVKAGDAEKRLAGPPVQPVFRRP